jgi:hypothetical protein
VRSKRHYRCTMQQWFDMVSAFKRRKNNMQRCRFRDKSAHNSAY